jgi:hypothetical protein
MANLDIMPFTAPRGGHDRMVTFERAAAATYNVGNWVLENGAGVIDEVAAGTEAIVSNTHFISAEDAEANIARIGDTRYVDPPNTARGDSVYPLWDENVEFVTRNVYNNSDTNIGPAGDGTTTIAVGDLVQGWVTVAVAGVSDHGLDVNVAGNLEVTRLLDALGRDTYLSGDAIDKVVFRLVATP